MDLKKIVVFVFLVFGGHFAQSQQLNLEETLDYINKSIEKGCRISLSSDGTIEKSYFLKNRKGKYKVHISDVRVPSDVEHLAIGDPYRILLWCNGSHKDNFGTNYVTPCILVISDNEIVDEEPYLSLYTVRGDSYSTRKLLNAVKYLFALAKENGLYERKNNIDNDPFAPSNHNPKNIEIISSSNIGSIKLEDNNGVYYIPITIGRVKRKFALDSGASEVLISTEFENELIRDGVIKKDSYLPPGLYQIADGSIVQCRRLIIPRLKIGGFTIRNVHASVGIGSVPLLMGKSVLDKFKKWEIDNSTKTLNLEK